MPALLALRWHALLFSLPYTALWARALGEDPRPGVGAAGALLIPAHAAAVLLAFALADRRDPQGRVCARLSPFARRWPDAHRPTSTSLVLLAMLAALFSIAAMFLDWRIGLAGLVTLLWAWLFGTSKPARRTPRVELSIPAFSILLPMLLVGASAWSSLARSDRPTPEDAEPIAVAAGLPLPHSVLAATAVGAVALGLITLLTLMRDAPADQADGVDSTPLRAGPGLAAFLVAVWVVGLVVLASMGAGWGWWTWAAPAIVGVAAIIGSGHVARAQAGAAAAAWWWAHAVLAFALLITIA